MVIDNKNGQELHPKLGDFKYKQDKEELRHMIQEISCIDLEKLEFFKRMLTSLLITENKAQKSFEKKALKLVRKK